MSLNSIWLVSLQEETFKMQTCKCMEERPCEGRQKMAIYKPKKKASEEINLPIPWYQTSRHQKYEKIHFYCLSHPVCDSLLWRPLQTNTNRNHVCFYSLIYPQYMSLCLAYGCPSMIIY